MKLKSYQLNGGPLDGTYGACSHDTYTVNGEVYVVNDEGRMVYAKDWLAILPKAQQAEERRRVEEMMKAVDVVPLSTGETVEMPAPIAMCIGISPRRINAWKYAINEGWNI